MGLFEIPHLQRSPHGILALVLGILLGGLGILITGAVARHRDTIIVGAIMLALQLALGITGFVTSMFALNGLGFLVYVWALVWGILIFVKSGKTA